MSENTQNLSFWNRLLTYYFEAKEAAVDRFKMPMIPYYLSLIVLSYWEPLYILIFSSKPVEDRTAYVRCMFQNYTLTDHLICLGIALGFAFISSIAFPYLTILINLINRTSKKLDKREHKLKSQEIKLSEKENIIHQLEIEDIKSGKKEKEEYNKAIESIKNSYEERINDIKQTHELELKNKEDSIKQLKNIKVIENENNVVNNQHYLDLYNFTKSRKSLPFLEEIIKKGYEIEFGTNRPQTQNERKLLDMFTEYRLGYYTIFSQHQKKFFFNKTGKFVVYNLHLEINEEQKSHQ